jgi:tetratricopeptide (TPR) repeat protein
MIDSLLQKLPGSRDKERVEILTNLCYEYRFIQPSQAIPYGLQALELAQKLGDLHLLSEAHNTLGIMYAIQGYSEKALYHFLQSMELTEHQKNPSRLAGLYNNIAGIYKMQGDNRKALIYLKKAYQIDLQTGSAEAVKYWNNAGVIYKDLGLLDSAIYCYEMRLQIAEKEVQIDSMRLAGLFQNLGRVYFLKKEYEKAINYYRETFAYIDHNANRSFEAQTLAGLAEVYFDRKEFSSAEENSLRALRIAEEENLLEIKESTLNLLAKCAAAQKKFESAFDYQWKHSAVRDSLSNRAKKRAIAEMQVRFETRQKEQELADVRQQSEIRKRIIWLVVALSTIGVLTLWLLYRQKKLRNRLLQQENEQLEQTRQNEEQINRLKQEKLTAELDFKNRELASLALHLTQKNEILQKISEELKSSSNGTASLQKLVKGNLDMDGSWKNFQLHFEQVHPQFFKLLEQRFPELSDHEVKLCSYIKIGLSNKEIAQLFNINPSSVEMSRYRLRKKLNLEAEMQLNDFIRGI